MMKKTYIVLFVVAATLGLAACDTGAPIPDPKIETETAISTLSETVTEATESAIGGVNDMTEAADQMANDAIDDAVNIIKDTSGVTSSKIDDTVNGILD
tara:strand:- start:423 stop:719 length:297 start_codon:yes stop_codon:yes gene_type:complete